MRPGLTASFRPIRFARFILVALAVLAVAGCVRSVDTGPKTLVILHTNDIHGKFTETKATWQDGNPPIGGFGNMSAVLDRERSKHPVLLLDAGDLMTGNPICDYDYEGVKGGAMMAFMNALDYDAMCLGNHEFDHGLENLDGLMELADFPILGANTYRPQGGRTAPLSHTIVKRGGLRIGVIGLITENLYGVAAPAKLAGTEVTSTVDEAQAIVNEIDDDTDVIVLLTHIGVGGDRRLAREVSGIDLIVGGHSHTRLKEAEVENGIYIVQTGAHGRNLGRVEITVEADRITGLRSELVELWPQEGALREIAAMVEEYETRIEADYGAVIGRLVTPWERSYSSESNIGNWLADCLLESVGGDFAVLNSGGIRKDVPAGPITKLDILEILPFSNEVTRFECSGAELLGMITHNAGSAANDRGVLQLAGLRYVYEMDGDDVEISSATVGGKPIDPAAIYTGVSVDYVSHGNSERYLGFEPSKKELVGEVVSSVIMRGVENASSIDARVDGRMGGVERGRSRRAG